MKLFIILLFIILLFIIISSILCIINNNIIENFVDIYGARPSSSGNQWVSGSIGSGSGYGSSGAVGSSSCEVGSICSTENGFGTINKNCVCVLNSGSDIKSKEEQEQEEGRDNRDVKDKIDKSLLDTSHDLTDCYPDNTDFDAICKKINSTYGIKEIIKCDPNNSKAVCGKNYINGNFLGNDTIITPCINKTDDFDTWCRYYNNKPVPHGYNVNSIGVRKLLVGKDGNCNFSNGKPDNHSARAVCDYNHIDQIYKLERANKKINYNVFTDCNPLKPTNFVTKCSDLLKIPYEHTFADQIMGYDCNPGFGRAKCIKSSEINNFNKSEYDERTFGIRLDIRDQYKDECNLDRCKK